MNVDIWVFYLQNFERCSKCSHNLNVGSTWMWTAFEGRQHLNVVNILMWTIFECPQCFDVVPLPLSLFLILDVIYFYRRGWGRHRWGEGYEGPSVARVGDYSEQCSPVYSSFWSRSVFCGCRFVCTKVCVYCFYWCFNIKQVPLWY